MQGCCSILYVVFPYIRDFVDWRYMSPGIPRAISRIFFEIYAECCRGMIADALCDHAKGEIGLFQLMCRMFQPQIQKISLR